MKHLLCIVALCLTTWVRAEAQGMEVSGSRVPLPEGRVLGAAFHEDRGMFFVQQLVFSNESGRRSHRQLSSWSLKNPLMIKARAFDQDPRGTREYPCGRVETSAKLHRLFLCSSQSQMEIIDPDTLATVGTMASIKGQTIRDFAIDDIGGRVLVLASWRDSIHLRVYSLMNGDKQQEVTLPATNAQNMSLSFAPKTRQIWIGVNVSSRGRDRTDIHACAAEAKLTCSKVTQIAAGLQIASLGTRLLVAANKFADDKKDCVQTVDPVTRSVSTEYCSPSTGVHFAVGVVSGNYVVGFTGMSKRALFSEEARSVASSFSVWRVETSQVAAVVKDQTDYGAIQNEVRIIGSRTEPLFLTYHRVSNALFLYSITDPN
jgi:hypothetical protein